MDTRIALIQALIPLGLQAVEEVLAYEVELLAGPRYARRDGTPHRVRWGRQRGSVYLADQKLPILVPRVRDRRAGSEVPLQTYARLQQPRAADEGVLRRILYGLSCRDYAVAAEAVPEAFGLSRSSISRRYVRATARKLRPLQERRLDGYDLVALVLDGKTFAEDTMVSALGITVQGQKVLLGFVQTGTENAATCADEDAARSLAEGLDETLTLHRLGLAERLGASLATTNGLELILALVEQRVGKVDCWTTSNQKQHWLATALLEIEPRLRRLRGYRALPQLRTALQQVLMQENRREVA